MTPGVILSREDGKGSMFTLTVAATMDRRKTEVSSARVTPYPDQRSLWRSDGSRKQYTVYIMSNTSMTLYAGITSDLRKRVGAHKCGEGSEFTSRYPFDRLVYFETYGTAAEAIAREKVIKGWSRSKKIALIKTMNPNWRDLTDEL